MSQPNPAEDRASWERQLQAKRVNLRLIDERMAEFVDHKSVPLDLIKARRGTIRDIRALEQDLGLPLTPETKPMLTDVRRRVGYSVALIVIAGMRRWPMLLILLLVSLVVFFVLLVLSMRRSCNEVAPVVQSFTVQYPEGTIKSFLPGEVVEISGREKVMIEAKILGQPVGSCIWSTGKGSITAAGECNTWYKPIFGSTNDFLNIVVRSQCKTESDAGLLIKIVLSRSQP
jgi:hypothetical protein